MHEAARARRVHVSSRSTHCQQHAVSLCSCISLPCVPAGVHAARMRIARARRRAGSHAKGGGQSQPTERVLVFVPATVVRHKQLLNRVLSPRRQQGFLRRAFARPWVGGGGHVRRHMQHLDAVPSVRLRKHLRPECVRMSSKASASRAQRSPLATLPAPVRARSACSGVRVLHDGSCAHTPADTRCAHCVEAGAA